MEDGETHPVARHDMREGDVVRGGEIRHIGGNERVGGAVHFCAGGEGEFEDGGGVSEGVDHAGGHVVGWAIYYEIAEPGLALVEGGVEGRARVEGEQAGEEGGPGGGEKVFGLERRVKMLVPILVRNQEGDGGSYICGLIDLSGLRLIRKSVPLVGIPIRNQRDLVEIPPCELLVWQVADELAVDHGTPVEHAVRVTGPWVRPVDDGLVEISQRLG